MHAAPENPAPEPAREPAPPPEAPPARPSVFRRVFFPLAFALCAVDLLSALWAPLLPPSGKAQKAADARGAFGRIFELNLEAKYILGIREIVARFAPEEAPDSSAYLAAIEKSESKIENRLEALLHLALYERLGAKAGAARMRERLAPEAAAPLAPSGNEAEPAMERVWIEAAPPSAAERAALEAKLGFLGRLSAARGLELGGEAQAAEAEAANSALASEAMRFAAIAMAGMLAAAALALAGLALLIAFFIEHRGGRIAWNFPPALVPARLMFETFTLYLIAMTLAREIAPFFAKAGIAGSIAVQALVPLVALYPLARGISGAALAADLGLARPASPPREVLLGPVGYIGALPMMGAGLAATMLLVALFGLDVGKGMHPIVPLVTGEGGSAMTIASVLFAAVIAAPIVEELMFRGFFYRALRSRFGAAGSVALSGFFFAAIHPQGWLGLPPLFAIGCALALLREWRGSLIAPMIAHACVNGVTLTMLLVMI